MWCEIDKFIHRISRKKRKPEEIKMRVSIGE